MTLHTSSLSSFNGLALSCYNTNKTKGGGKMKKILLITLIVASLFALSACSPSPVGNGPVSYEDGTYRGVFIDRGGVEVVVQFALKDNIVTATSYRMLSYGGNDYLDPQNDVINAISKQYHQAISHLEGKDIRESVEDFYQPGDFVENVDGHSGATIRANKVRSALQDALNRGVYSK